MHSADDNPCLYGCGGWLRTACVGKKYFSCTPDLEPEDIREALQFAAEAVCEREIPLIGSLKS